MKATKEKIVHLAPATPRPFWCPECRVENKDLQPLRFVSSSSEQWGTVVTRHDYYRCRKCGDRFVSTNGRKPELAA
jgi:hypothetical protein